MAVNLTSERVRTALMLEGIRGGQSLGALLGYQFERGLHDRHGLAEVDEFIFTARVPAARRPPALDEQEPDVPIEAIEARNVDRRPGAGQHIKKSGSKTYPLRAPLPAASREAAAIDAEVERMFDSTTPSPIWRWRRASIRPCSATMTASRRPRRLHAATSRPSRGGAHADQRHRPDPPRRAAPRGRRRSGPLAARRESP